MINKLNKRFLNINKTTGLMLLIVKFVIIELLLIALWQGEIYSRNNEIALNENPYLEEINVKIEYCTGNSQGECMIHSSEESYLLYSGKYDLSIEPALLIGKTVTVEYITFKNLLRTHSWSGKLRYILRDLLGDKVVLGIREGNTVYYDIDELSSGRIKLAERHKRNLTILFILLSIVWYIICDFRLSNYTYYTTPLEWMVERIPLLFLWGEKRKAYRKKLKEDRLHYDRHIEELAVKERARLTHKKDEKYQKKVQRRKRRKRKMKKK